MKITQGFVAALPDGKYLYINHHQKQLMEVNAVSELESATVRNQPGARDRAEAAALMKLSATWISVTVRREVLKDEPGKGGAA